MSTEEKKILNSNDITNHENERLCKWAIKHEIEETKSDETHRTKLRRDRDRILYSGGFRRLQDKTQVLAATKHGDHRTRLTHTLEVEQIAVSIADALSLNKDLVSAIALGHDVGHTPFGHAVESVLNKKLSEEEGFSHAVQSVRYLQKQAFNGKGAHLTDEVVEGILMHDTDVYAENLDNNKAPSLEGQVVYWADKIAYLTHDFEDFRDQKIMETAIKENELLENEIKIILTCLLEEDKCKEVINDLAKYETRDLIRNIINQLLIGSKENLDGLANELLGKDKFPQYAKKQTYIRVKEKEEEYNLTEKDTQKYKEEITKLFNLEQEIIDKKINDINSNLKKKKNKLNETIKKLDSLKDPKIKVENEPSINEEYIEQNKKVNNLVDERDILIEIKDIVKDINDNVKEEKKEEKKKEKINKIVSKRIKKLRKKSYQDGLLINFTDDYRKRYLLMREMLDKHYIGSPTVKRSDAKAERIVEFLFDEFTKNTKVLPLNIQSQIKDDGPSKNRVVADYIASMTDRYANETYTNINTMDKEYNY